MTNMTHDPITDRWYFSFKGVSGFIQSHGGFDFVTVYCKDSGGIFRKQDEYASMALAVREIESWNTNLCSEVA